MGHAVLVLLTSRYSSPWRRALVDWAHLIPVLLFSWARMSER